MKYGDNFQQLSKYRRDTLRGRALDWSRKPDLYKKYPAGLERFTLEEPERSEGLPLYSAISLRRSVRDFKNKAVSESKLSQVLWASQGITAQSISHQFRAAPSAGALYPVETYCLINRVDNLMSGIYHYQITDHKLTLLREGRFGQTLAGAALSQNLLAEASFVLIWSAIVERGRWKYEQRVYRYIYLDAGHIAQNAALAAVSCGLSSCPIGAFFDDEVNKIIDIDGEKETAIYMIAIGEPE